MQVKESIKEGNFKEFPVTSLSEFLYKFNLLCTLNEKLQKLCTIMSTWLYNI